MQATTCNYSLPGDPTGTHAGHHMYLLSSWRSHRDTCRPPHVITRWKSNSDINILFTFMPYIWCRSLQSTFCAWMSFNRRSHPCTACDIDAFWQYIFHSLGPMWKMLQPQPYRTELVVIVNTSVVWRDIDVHPTYTRFSESALGFV